MLLSAGRSLGQSGWIVALLRALDWLMTVQTSAGGAFAPVGNRGFYVQGGAPDRLDQQPVDAHATVAACIAAYRLTGDQRWRHHARWTFEWSVGAITWGFPWTTI